jgi:hypothetical protein
MPAEPGPIVKNVYEISAAAKIFPTMQAPVQIKKPR